MRLFTAFIRWPIIWLGYVGLILLAGTLVGILAFVVFGTLIGGNALLAMVEHGARNGFLYSGVWAGGVSIVLCFIHGHREKQAAASAEEFGESGPSGGDFSAAR